MPAAAGPDAWGSGDPVPTPAGKAACGEQGAGISPQHLRLAGGRGGAQPAPSRGCCSPGQDAAVHRAAAIASEKGAIAWRQRGGREQRNPDSPKVDACGCASSRAGRRCCFSVSLSPAVLLGACWGSGVWLSPHGAGAGERGRPEAVPSCRCRCRCGAAGARSLPRVPRPPARPQVRRK